MNKAIITVANPTRREILAPYITRLRISLPYWSVPKICSEYGFLRMFDRFCSEYEYGAIRFANMAIRMRAASTKETHICDLISSIASRSQRIWNSGSFALLVNAFTNFFSLRNVGSPLLRCSEIRFDLWDQRKHMRHLLSS